MTKLSISLTAATLTLSLASAANAYGTAPETEPDLSPIMQVNFLFGTDTQSEDGTCDLDMTPVLANALGLLTTDNADDAAIALAACTPK